MRLLLSSAIFIFIITLNSSLPAYAAPSGTPKPLNTLSNKMAKLTHIFKNLRTKDPSNSPKSTQNQVALIKEVFANFESINIHDIYDDPDIEFEEIIQPVQISDQNGDLFFKKTYEVSYSILKDGELAKAQSKIFTNVSIASLPRHHSYNYVITKSGDIIFGLIDNSWEFGVKHPNLAGTHDIVAAGELKLYSKRRAEFNLRSGTFMAHLFERMTKSDMLTYNSYRDILAEAVQLLFHQQLGRFGKLKFTSQVKHHHPNFREALLLCKSALIPNPTNKDTCKKIQEDYERWTHLRVSILKPEPLSPNTHFRTQM